MYCLEKMFSLRVTARNKTDKKSLTDREIMRVGRSYSATELAYTTHQSSGETCPNNLVATT